MAIYNSKYEISYFAAPKCASSSLKAVFFYLENGFEWRQFTRNGRVMHIHNVYPGAPFDVAKEHCPDGHWKFAVVRDPIKRLASCYKNRVLTGPYQQRIKAKKGLARRLGVTEQPSFPTFVENLEAYREFSPDLEGHTDPMSKFLGTDVSFYDRIYDVSELDTLQADLTQRCGMPVTIPHLQTRGQGKKVEGLNARLEQKLRDFYAEDYRMFGDHLERLAA